MKFLLIRCLPLLIALSCRSHSQTINWGNEYLGKVVDSDGFEVDNTFFFELGGFINGFDPTRDPISQWLDNWQVLDSATYNAEDEQFAGSVDLRNEATRDNPTGSTASFAGLEAYIWIRKGDLPVAGSEWLLLRAEDWVFPAIDDCCGTGLYEFSTFVDDIALTDVPLWGRQNTVSGPGVYTSDGTSEGWTPTLQTYTFIPEPSASTLLAMAVLGMLSRRRR